ncbi:hypothetical protein R1sor_019475 [Riccia sorocarpa]|uniref:Bifunctional inhibitor/plant lipid transfer protein/seed storage helical domain-containing protein n=1 Tax=Riccia sorocarpa TaxID=122646 RepID=A0ABD3ICL9_9MARC
MAGRMVALLALSMILGLSGFGNAQTISAADCTPSLVQIAPCLSFVQGKSQTPSEPCCTALGGVITNNPTCLCYLIGYGGSKNAPPATFNQTLAKELPSMCNLSANEEKCPALVGGAPLPSPPVASGPAPPPTAGGQGSSATSVVASVSLLLSCAAAALFHSFY